MIDPFYSSQQWFKLRRKALRRDQHKCRMCGSPVHGKKTAHVDHIKKRKQHPELALRLDNLQTLCRHCHNSTKQYHEKNPDAGANADGFPVDGSWN